MENYRKPWKTMWKASEMSSKHSQLKPIEKPLRRWERGLVSKVPGENRNRLNVQTAQKNWNPWTPLKIIERHRKPTESWSRWKRSIVAVIVAAAVAAAAAAAAPSRLQRFVDKWCLFNLRTSRTMENQRKSRKTNLKTIATMAKKFKLERSVTQMICL